MCCCGDDTKTITQVAGILGIIQSFVGIVLASVSIDEFFYLGVDGPIISQALSNRYTIKVLLVLILLLQLYWFLSSIGLIFANKGDHTCGIRQWLVSTSFIIVAEVVFPIIVLSTTVYDARNGLMKQTVVNSIGTYYSRTTLEYFIDGFMNSYLTIFFSFSNAGLITLVLNIVMCIYVGRRVDSITGVSGRVIAPAAVTVVVPSQVIAQPMQPYMQPYGPMVLQAPQQTMYSVQQIPVQQQAFQPQNPYQQPPPPPYTTNLQ